MGQNKIYDKNLITLGKLTENNKLAIIKMKEDIEDNKN
jgi:hypothetical protein